MDVATFFQVGCRFENLIEKKTVTFKRHHTPFHNEFTLL